MRTGTRICMGLVIAPVAICHVAASAALLVLRAVAWPLERIQGQCVRFVTSLRGLKS